MKDIARWNKRRWLMEGIRARIERETCWSRLKILYTALFDAGDLSA